MLTHSIDSIHRGFVSPSLSVPAERGDSRHTHGIGLCQPDSTPRRSLESPLRRVRSNRQRASSVAGPEKPIVAQFPLRCAALRMVSTFLFEVRTQPAIVADCIFMFAIYLYQVRTKQSSTAQRRGVKEGSTARRDCEDSHS